MSRGVVKELFILYFSRRDKSAKSTYFSKIAYDGYKFYNICLRSIEKSSESKRREDLEIIY